MSHKRLYAISTSSMISAISKLRIEKGDCLLVKDQETLMWLSEHGPRLDFQVPLIFAPKGIESLSRQDLMNLVEQIDEQHHESSPVPDGSNAPL